MVQDSRTIGAANISDTAVEKILGEVIQRVETIEDAPAPEGGGTTMLYDQGTPEDYVPVSVAATATATPLATTVEDDSLTVDGIMLTFKDSPAGEDEVATGSVDSDTNAALLLAAFQAHSEYAAQDYTVALENSQLTFTAKVAGVDGNSINISYVNTGGSWDSVVNEFSGGLDAADGVGEDGDYYTDIDSGTVYGPRTDGAWDRVFGPVLSLGAEATPGLISTGGFDATRFDIADDSEGWHLRGTSAEVVPGNAGWSMAVDPGNYLTVTGVDNGYESDLRNTDASSNESYVNIKGGEHVVVGVGFDPDATEITVHPDGLNISVNGGEGLGYDGQRLTMEGYAVGGSEANNGAAPTDLAKKIGLTFVLRGAAGQNIALPAMAEGMKYKFVIGGVPTSASWTITPTDADSINGYTISMEAVAVKNTATAADVVTFVMNACSIGDWVELVCDGTQWVVTGVQAANAGVTFTG